MIVSLIHGFACWNGEVLSFETLITLTLYVACLAILSVNKADF